MRTLHMDDDGVLEAATSSLRAGEVIVVPTDTVYGVAVLPTLPAAVDGIYAAKDRPKTHHLPVMAGSLGQVATLGVHLDQKAKALAEKWWPGPLTLVMGFDEHEQRPDWLQDREEVAIRIPDHSFLLSLLRRTGPLLVTSANQHGSATPPTAEQAAEELGGWVSLMVDGGTLQTVPSTLVNVRSAAAVVEREGAIARQDVAAVLDRVGGSK
ncbi:MAG TPA: L-threonylcarbamoyladenylate synthase [Acidimicrobiales bacterium]